MTRTQTALLILFLVTSGACATDSPEQQGEDGSFEVTYTFTPRGSPGRTLVVQSPPRPLDTRGETSARYPNELVGFQLHAEAKWAELEPTISTLADVRRVLGEPDEATDIARYGEAYPGDDRAEQPLLIYQLEPGWALYVYLIKSDASTRDDFDKSVWDTVGTLDILPDDDVSFAEITIPETTFDKKGVFAADARWHDFRDEHGLTYSIYRNGSGNKLGTLNRISYGPSDARLAELGSP